MSNETTITVRWRQPGFHYWENAKEITGSRRAYLSDRHRHLFHYELTVAVFHDDRDIEFHDLLDQVSEFTSSRTEHEGRSCEMLAKEILDWFEETYETKNRHRSCSVFEDGEVGATVER